MPFAFLPPSPVNIPKTEGLLVHILEKRKMTIDVNSSGNLQRNSGNVQQKALECAQSIFILLRNQLLG